MLERGTLGKRSMVIPDFSRLNSRELIKFQSGNTKISGEFATELSTALREGRATVDDGQEPRAKKLTLGLTRGESKRLLKKIASPRVYS